MCLDGCCDRFKYLLAVLADERDDSRGFLQKLSPLLQDQHRNIAAGHAGEVGHDTSRKLASPRQSRKIDGLEWVTGAPVVRYSNFCSCGIGTFHLESPPKCRWQILEKVQPQFPSRADVLQVFRCLRRKYLSRGIFCSQSFIVLLITLWALTFCS